MGLMLYSLSEIPENEERSFFIYLLDYGWHEPLGDIVMQNFEKISKRTSKNNSVFIKGIDSSHVNNEVLSWHHVNGEKGENILPAILITTMNPHKFRIIEENEKNKYVDKMIFIPLKSCCENSTDVMNLIEKIFEDIENGKELKDFKITKIMKKGIGKRIVDGVIAQPNFMGLGVDIRKILS